MGVSKNSGTPKSSILIRFSITFSIHFGGTPIFWKHPYASFMRFVRSDCALPGWSFLCFTCSVSPRLWGILISCRNSFLVATTSFQSCWDSTVASVVVACCGMFCLQILWTPLESISPNQKKNSRGQLCQTHRMC